MVSVEIAANERDLFLLRLKGEDSRLRVSPGGETRKTPDVGADIDDHIGVRLRDPIYVSHRRLEELAPIRDERIFDLDFKSVLELDQSSAISDPQFRGNQ